MSEHTRVSAKGQVVIPKSLRDQLGWPAGTRLQVDKVGGAVTLRPIRNRPGSLTIEEFIARRPPYHGEAKSLQEIEAAVARGMARQFSGAYRTGR